MNDEENFPSPENERIIKTAGIIAFDEGSILLVRHDPDSQNSIGTYGIPGGKLEPGEDLKEAAIREFTEETGLVPQPDEVLEFENNYVVAKVPRKNRELEKMDFTVFKLKKIMGELKAGSDGTPVWLSLKQIEKLDREKMLAPNTLALVNEALKSY